MVRKIPKLLRKILMAFGLMMPIAASGVAIADTGPGNFPADGKYQVTTPSGLEYTDVKVGDGATPKTGQDVTVHYAGYLLDGKKFDASRDHGGKPFTFTIGEGQVIKGWDEGVMGMKVGGERLLRIPPDLGYGARGAGGAIPPNATLLFDVELLGVQ
jgi:peptidylprolyl isomerase